MAEGLRQVQSLNDLIGEITDIRQLNSGIQVGRMRVPLGVVGMIYESRPHFCRVNEFSSSFKKYLKNGDKFLIDCCTQHISSIYGRKSEQMKDFKSAISRK